MTDAPKSLTEGPRVNYELKAVAGSRLVTLVSCRSMEQVMQAAPKTAGRVLSIWAVPESGGNARLVAVRNRDDQEWTPIETPRE